MRFLDIAYRELSQEDRARALDKVQRDYGDTVLTLVTQRLSVDMSLTTREAVMKETGSWPQWPEAKKRRNHATRTKAKTADEPPAPPEAIAVGDADHENEAYRERGVGLCDKARDAGIDVLKFAYDSGDTSLIDLAAGLIREAACCRRMVVSHVR